MLLYFVRGSMKSFFRRFLYPRHKRKIFTKLEAALKSYKCRQILADPKYKNILIMDTIPYGTCFKQRPHHISENLAEHFDITMYKSNWAKDFVFLNDKILLYPMLSFKKVKNKNIVYYIDSINEGKNIKDVLKIKKLGYKIIYDYIDEFSNKICKTKKPYSIYKNLEKLNPDLIITASKKLYNDVIKRFPAEKIVLAQNAVCPEDFIETNIEKFPNDIKQIAEQGKPIVGYYGCIARWLDYDLLSETAEKCKDLNFVFIGKDSQLCTQKLKMHDNVYFLGKKEYKELPLYASHFSCCIIPFQNGNIAKATSPVKLFEFMALKKPVVCTRDLDECRGYEGVLMSDNDENFIENLYRAIELSNKQEIQEKLFSLAKENSWASRAENIYQKMRDL